MKTFFLKCRSCLKSSRAYTLVEVLVSFFIFAMISGSAVTVFMSSTDLWKINNVKLELQQELRKSMDWMNIDLLQAGASTMTNVPANGTWYTTITFNTATGVTEGSTTWSSNTIQFVLGGSSSNQLQRVSGAATKVIAQDVKSLQFRRQSSTPNILEVSMQAQKSTIRGASMTMASRFKVTLRN